KLQNSIEQALEAVASLDEDRILRSLTNLVMATLRTNFYQLDENGEPKTYLAVKMNSAKIKDLPKPVPYREIFVYSPRVEGIHLRGDVIARGGIRWSDRHEDFRTEVLGLMKAQQVKNSVIVPMGAKGGFVVKRPPLNGDRKAQYDEGVACYKRFISGLLEITDNRKGKKVVPPKNVVRHDGDDPYLVVAADKGTATFSDIANGLSQEYGFWLDDAFASGGSAGYDHKEMGITARGAWESVKRHFREMNHDTQSKDFDVIGVGDMGGDVFGNGMLLSEHIRLVGAFNHLHIFCDPDPDAASSFKERKRLFEAVSGWGEYDESKLSKGGRIYSRSDKSLTLTPEIMKRFDIQSEKVPPSELMKAMLKARTDLLWFGGIGTYIKAKEETHEMVGDKANDAIRINAEEVRAHVLGEGANLAVTQAGRINYAEKGGKVNADFIDNAGGVDSSDHEVNIKILMTEVMSHDKHKMTLKKRDQLLEKMTDDIA
ncbi:MAG: NAD-glutamate dehydrogenase domain-containing protein, partial [Pseudomonadota bacterium]|nr:NAD-glutamate dehydrogenase domain-containing protein [Pseudomonadota bacterium]